MILEKIDPREQETLTRIEELVKGERTYKTQDEVLKLLLYELNNQSRLKAMGYIDRHKFYEKPLVD